MTWRSLLAFVVAAVPSASARAQDAAPSAADLAGCWCVEVGPSPSPWPDSLAHLPAPSDLPGAVRLSLPKTPHVRVPSGDVPDGARTIETPDGYTRFPFQYWSYDGARVVIGSYHPSGHRLALRPEGPGRLVGTLTAYGAGDYAPLPQPQTWTTRAILTRTSCDDF